MFLVGSIIGGFIAKQFMSTDQPVQISAETISDLAKLGIAAPASLQPAELFCQGSETI